MSRLEPLRYTSEEFTLPDGVGVEALDWTAIAWMMGRRKGGKTSMIKILVTPGVMVQHKKVTGARPEVDVRIQPDEPWFMGTVDYAIVLTEGMIREDYMYMAPPVVFEVESQPTWPILRTVEDEDGNRHGLPVRTLGDAVSSKSSWVINDVFHCAGPHWRGEA